MKKTLFAIALCTYGLQNLATAQIIMSTGTINLTCGTPQTYYETGGLGNTILPPDVYTYINQTFTTNDPAFPVTISFSSFGLEFGYVYLRVFNGPSIASPQIGVFTENTIPNDITSTHPSGALTFQLDIDDEAYFNPSFSPGWIATISGGSGTPILSQSITDESCQDENGAINLTNSATTDVPYTFSWSNGANSEDLSGLNAGTYTVTVTSSSGCSAGSVLTVNNVGEINSIATDNGDLSITSSVAAAYQWINCQTGLPIAGQTSQTLIVSENGEYAVIGTSATNCSDTSACVLIDYVSLESENLVEMTFSPNPTDGEVKISFNSLNGNYTIRDAQGKLIQSNSISSESTISLKEFNAGIYFFELTTESGSRIERIVKK